MEGIFKAAMLGAAVGYILTLIIWACMWVYDTIKTWMTDRKWARWMKGGPRP